MDNPQIVRAQFNELKSRYRNISLNSEGALWTVSGVFGFRTEINNEEIIDRYQLQLYIPRAYPLEAPKVYETGERIPKLVDNHVYTDSGRLCLGTDVAVQLRFLKSKNLRKFVDEQVVYYLAGYSYFCEHDEWPFGELDHGSEGIIQYYSEYFNIDNAEKVKLLMYISSGMALNMPGKKGPCLCGSGKTFGNCHYGVVRRLRKRSVQKIVQMDLINVMDNKLSKQREPEKKVLMP